MLEGGALEPYKINEDGSNGTKFYNWRTVCRAMGLNLERGEMRGMIEIR